MSIYGENIKNLQFISHFPKIISNIHSIFFAREISGKPFGIKFEVSSRCNLKCIMCPLSKGLKRKQGLLKFEKFRKIYDEIGPSYLNLTGIGEPLLNPDLFKIINYAKKGGSIVKLDSNATLLNEEKASKLLSVNPDIVSISVDGVNKKSYEKIRKGANFDRVLKNLKNFIKIRDSSKSKTKIHVNFVLQKENIKELIKFIKFLDSLRIDSINGDIALPLGGNKNSANRKINTEIINELKKELRKIKTRASLNIEHIIEFLECGGDISKKKGNHCFYAWYYPSITWDGYVVPCCYICDNEIVFGNVFETPFMEIWNNQKLRNFRKMISSKRKGLCKNCFIDEKYITDKLKILNKIPLIKNFSARKFN